jgi:hypothetical protein
MSDNLPVIVSTVAPTEEQTDELGRKSVIGKHLDAETILQEIPIETIRKNLKAFCDSIGRSLQDIQEVGRFKLTEVTLSIEVSAEGGIQLIGTSKVAGKGAITLTFTGAA